MMARLGTRLAKLEAANPPREKIDIAFSVLEDSLPSGDPREWAGRILLDLDHPGALLAHVVEGEARKVLLPPTDSEAIGYHSPEERILQLHHYARPRFEIFGVPGQLISLTQHLAAGGEVEWLNGGAE